MQCRSDLCERADPTHLPKAQPPELQRVRRKAVFHPGTEPLELIGVHGIPVGVSICEDIWIDDGPHVDLVNLGAELIVTINGSPYHLDKDSGRNPHHSARHRTSCSDRVRQPGGWPRRARL